VTLVQVVLGWAAQAPSSSFRLVSMRYDAMGYDAMRCDAIRCDAIRCDAMPRLCSRRRAGARPIEQISRQKPQQVASYNMYRSRSRSPATTCT
jgi:hypothetical protein